MLDLTLEQVFGAGATQTATTLTITKADLPGLTATSSNRAEQLLAALVLQAHQVFQGLLTDENNQSITDEYGNPFSYANQDFFEKLALTFWKTQPIERNGANYLLSTFVADFFVNPPVELGTPLDPDSLDY